jgi:hypothetical protein
MAPTGDLSQFIRPIELTADNGAFYARKEGFMAYQEGIRKTYTCLCQRTKWPGRLCRREATWDHRRPLPK